MSLKYYIIWKELGDIGGVKFPSAQLQTVVTESEAANFASTIINQSTYIQNSLEIVRGYQVEFNVG